jgi:predicted enzyme related to lactoylglutathione lyase
VTEIPPKTDTTLSPRVCTLDVMTNAMTPNSLAWFEVATDDPDTATSFYADLFGWTFSPFADPETAGIDYRVATLPGSDVPFGGVLATGGAMPGHAVFYIAVTDVAATCEATEQLGGKVVNKQLAPPAGPPFAYLRDPVGSLFGVFTPPA